MLQDGHHIFTHHIEAYLIDRNAIKRDHSLRQRVEANQQLDQGRFPPPLAPTSATRSPGATSKLIECRTSRPLP